MPRAPRLAVPADARVPHPALRLPGRDGALDAATWEALPTTDEGVRLLIRDPPPYLSQVREVLSGPLDALPLDALAHLARYVPALTQRRRGWRRVLAGVLRRHAPGRPGAPKAALAVELGCSVGGELRTLRRHARHVVGVDSNPVPLRVARLQLDGRPVPRLARVEGRSFRSLEPLVLPAVTGVTVVAGDALDPPLAAGEADLVLAANLLDNVRSPLGLVLTLDRLLRPGGLLVLTSPFHWVDAITPPAEQLGGGTVPAWAARGSAAGLAELLRGETPLAPDLRYEILEARNASWRVRDHDRCELVYRVHILAARKAS